MCGIIGKTDADGGMCMQIIDCAKDSGLECFRGIALAGETAAEAVAAEHRISVFLNERLAMRLTCTPQHLDELVIGRLRTEGLIRRAEDVRQLYICEQGLRARVTLEPDAAERLTEPEAETVGTCCTDNRTLLSGAEEPVPVTPVPWKAAWLRHAAEGMRREQQLYEATHAVHACCLFREDRILCCREDIGRHNALDKAIGWALIAEEDLTRCMLFTTGRLPTDMVSKAIRAGVPLLVSKTFPTDLGVELARTAHLTLVTLRPDGRIIVWSGEE